MEQDDERWTDLRLLIVIRDTECQLQSVWNDVYSPIISGV